MKLDKMFSSKWLRAADVDEIADEETGTAIVTVDRVEMADVGQGAESQEKPVVYFKGIEPGLVLNKTNAATLGKLLGNETDDWKGKSVGLFTTEVDFAGNQVLAIRVRMKLPKQKKVQAEEEVEMPF